VPLLGRLAHLLETVLANEEPPGTVAAQAPLVSPALSIARWTFSPVILADCALIYAATSPFVDHLPAWRVGEVNAVSDFSANRATRNRLDLLCHKREFYAPMLSDSINSASMAGFDPI